MRCVNFKGGEWEEVLPDDAEIIDKSSKEREERKRNERTREAEERENARVKQSHKGKSFCAKQVEAEAIEKITQKKAREKRKEVRIDEVPKGRDPGRLERQTAKHNNGYERNQKHTLISSILEKDKKRSEKREGNVWKERERRRKRRKESM